MKKLQKIRETKMIVKDLRALVDLTIIDKTVYMCPIMTCAYEHTDRKDVIDHVLFHKLDDIVGALEYYS